MSKRGRPPFDVALKFRILVLQALHGLSRDQAEYLVCERLSWMRFCWLGPVDAVPDATRVAASPQRNTSGEMTAIKVGKRACDIRPEKLARLGRMSRTSPPMRSQRRAGLIDTTNMVSDV